MNKKLKDIICPSCHDPMEDGICFECGLQARIKAKEDLDQTYERWNKKQLQKIIDDMKEPLMEYWTNEVNLPLSIQLHSMALMDLFLHDLDLQSFCLSNKKNRKEKEKENERNWKK